MKCQNWAGNILKFSFPFFTHTNILNKIVKVNFFLLEDQNIYMPKPPGFYYNLNSI